MATPVNPTTEKIIRALKSRWDSIKSGYLRDSFAKSALQGLLTGESTKGVDEHRIARMAYAQADAMMAVRGERS